MALEDFSDIRYLLPFILTLIIIGVKFTLGFYLARKVNQRKKENGKIQIDFIFAICVMMFCIGISRTLYFYFDFFLTHFDPSLFYITPNIYYWKAATFFSTIGIVFVLFIMDKKIYHFKLKGLFAYLLLIVSLIQVFYPVGIETGEADFKTISTIGIFGTLLGAIIPLTFIYMAIKSSGEIRKLSIILVICIMAYGLGAQLMSEPFLAAIESSGGINARLAVIIIVPIIRS
jgi:uncharacterized membrane protein